MTPLEFIARWKNSGGAELANSQSFLKELCDLLEVPQPEPTQTDESHNRYVFEKAVTFNNGDGSTSVGRVDLFRSQSFVLESKQGTERKAAELEALATATKQKKFRSGTAERGTAGWALAMSRAREQARRYAEAIPGEWPPFLIVCDVGFCFDLYADFSQSGKNYSPFPDTSSFRIKLDDLANPDVRTKLRTIWLEPHSLDPAKRTAKVTRELAERLAKLAKSLEGKHPPDQVAQFLMRCLFTMFAEDVELGGLKKGDFTKFLTARRGKATTFVPMLTALWQTMDTGGFSTILESQIKQFNGGLFEEQTVLPLTEDQLELLIEAAEAEWTDVEPAIFGTLLERALDPHERHKLGAHYTPRAYVERLVMPTIIEPLREDWANAYATAVSLHESGKVKNAQEVVREFHEKLCATRVLDPACGSGNFLYVSLELMKKLEGEVLKTLQDLGDKQAFLETHTIDPHQFLGIEINPRAAAITDLVLWIGYLQWHFRTRGKNADVSEPIIRKFHNIECRDAVLAWDSIEPVVDSEGKPVTRWDGRTTKPHPVTGEEVPDETARVQELKYINPRKAEWPQADFIVGNPPFIGSQFMMESLGRGYTNSLRNAYADDIPGSADFVMYWWKNGAELVGVNGAKRCGFITTNSLRQAFNSRIVAASLTALEPVSLIFAIPDHPWVTSEDGAAVRISMTVTEVGSNINGRLVTVSAEKECATLENEVVFETSKGRINPNLTLGTNVTSITALDANRSLCFMGVKLVGAAFVIDKVTHDTWEQSNWGEKLVRPFLNGRDVTQSPRGSFVIDTFGISADSLRDEAPEIFQHLFDRVKPERDARKGKSKDADEYASRWWQHAKPRPDMRASLQGLNRYIVTSEVSKHRTFVFVGAEVLADGALIVTALADSYFLGVMSSRVHNYWSLCIGGTLEDRPRYNKTRCFDPYPFPDATEPQKQRIRELGEQLDAHRKRQQELHPTLTMTGMYNVLEKLRSGEPLTDKEKIIHEQGLVSVLKQIHDDLDAAVFAAYGWPTTLTDEEILERLVALNHERAEEEKRGLIRWLRPEFQNPSGGQTIQPTLVPDEPDDEEEQPKKKPAKVAKEKWPASLPERIKCVRAALIAAAKPVSPQELASRFTKVKADAIEELLETLAAIGQARELEGGRFAV